ncbi:MAG: hypothetical protein KC413_07705 [Anaerolineales bacterium]|nr:hypothetical protein [Anaerolineales bacterium]MCA9975619.1 hypothetical protein [Anaerolineales bacterium]MCB8966268.1 hypothetical protein [Ardenticatenaceae bacterium]
MSEAREALEERVRKAIFQESIFRWESAVVISLSLLLTAVTALGALGDGLQSWWWIWLIGGLLAEAALVYSSLTDPKFGEKVAASLLRTDFKPERLRDKKLQQQIIEALDYRSRIEEAMRSRDDSLIKDELTQTGVQIDEWIEHIYDLARRIDRYRPEARALAKDRQNADARIAQLEQELILEDDAAVKKQIEITLEGLRRQVDTLERLDNTIQRAELQLENTLTSLRTIYSQSMLVDAKDIDNSRARRLRHEITEEVKELNDVLVAMDEVYAAE